MSQTHEKSLSLPDQVAIELREDIIGGRLLPGMPLVESELVNAYNASRNTVREALHQLGREGLTSYVRNKGVMVRRMGIDDVRDLFKVRRTLELQAIAASKPLREFQSDLMLDAIEAAQLARDRENWQAFGTHSLRFHQHIVGLMRSPLFDEFFTHVAAQMRLVFSNAPNEETFQKPWFERDRHIHDLLGDGRKKEAGEAMSSYLNDSELVLLDILNNRAKH
ncbi:GntR family transcriptional regulator [Pseudomonas botevensis]|uniref:GntR family transcriptional regulator n=1 Tax=Pseudomonas botevensis TaxID=2842352 RepID=UPI001C3D8637|nr:GntR family transcriptional regulator [Pseudomonas botevensis]MBV4476809.1 GntR family transcriptional regulator [Pseudomonas botevensis]